MVMTGAMVYPCLENKSRNLKKDNQKKEKKKKTQLTQVGARSSCELWQECKLTGAG